MGLANNDILLSKTTRSLIFCATHQLENFIKQGYRVEEAERELESRRTWRAADGAKRPQNSKVSRHAPPLTQTVGQTPCPQERRKP